MSFAIRELYWTLADAWREAWSAAAMRLGLAAWLVRDAWREFWRRADLRERLSVWLEIVTGKVPID